MTRTNALPSAMGAMRTRHETGTRERIVRMTGPSGAALTDASFGLGPVRLMAVTPAF